MDSAQAKFVALVSLGVGSIFVGILPVCFTKQSRTQWPLFLSCLLCFGGGVLLSTALVHILPEAREAAKQPYQTYTELFFCVGFFILYLLDEIVHYFYGELAGHSHETPPQTSRYGTNENQSLLHHSDMEQLPYNPNFVRCNSDSALLFNENQLPSQLCHAMHQEPCQSSVSTMNFGLLVALSVHSLLEGLVVGLEDITSKVLLLLGAIASHKLVVGFCLGVELASTETISFCKHFVCVLMFAGASVMGIFLGIVISDIPPDVRKIVIPILQALSGGTLLYVTVSEVLPRERARWHRNPSKRGAGIFQLISVIIGFILMSLLAKYLEH